MDITQAKAILDKYGRENCMQIIFDNGRVWLTCVPKRSTDPKEAKRGLPARDPLTHKIIFEYFDFKDKISNWYRIHIKLSIDIFAELRIKALLLTMLHFRIYCTGIVG